MGDPAEDAAFQQLKALLIETTKLTYPDPSRQYILDTEASNEAAGAVLSQMVEGEKQVMAYCSKTFSPFTEELLCDSERTTGGDDGSKSLPAIPLWTRIPLKYRPRVAALVV